MSCAKQGTAPGLFNTNTRESEIKFIGIEQPWGVPAKMLAISFSAQIQAEATARSRKLR